VDSNDPVATATVHAIHMGDTTSLSSLLSQHPGLASEEIHETRTPLHVVTDWPGYFPAGPATVRLLIGAGADPNAVSGGNRPETPLHWAASSDDADVADALIGGGAGLETPGGSIGTPLDNAVGYGCWNVARLLVQRGARRRSLVRSQYRPLTSAAGSDHRTAVFYPDAAAKCSNQGPASYELGSSHTEARSKAAKRYKSSPRRSAGRGTQPVRWSNAPVGTGSADHRTGSAGRRIELFFDIEFTRVEVDQLPGESEYLALPET
jgi:hypothetical protein